MEVPAEPESPLNVLTLSPVLVAQRLDQALKSFLQDHPDIPLEQALAMWKEAGG